MAGQTGAMTMDLDIDVVAQARVVVGKERGWCRCFGQFRGKLEEGATRLLKPIVACSVKEIKPEIRAIGFLHGTTWFKGMLGFR